jgi:hypothetical protein
MVIIVAIPGQPHGGAGALHYVKARLLRWQLWQTARAFMPVATSGSGEDAMPVAALAMMNEILAAGQPWSRVIVARVRSDEISIGCNDQFEE